MTTNEVILTLTIDKCIELLNKCNSCNEIANELFNSPSLSVKAKNTLFEKFESYGLLYQKLKTKTKGPIWDMSKLEFIQLTKKFPNPKNFLIHLNVNPTSSNFATLKNRFKLEGLDYAIYKKTKGHNISEHDLKEDSIISTISLKKYIVDNKLIDYICCFCGQEPLWMGRELPLNLFHKNNKANDNRIENIGFICANCQLQKGIN